jgi:glucans biosynthesis protein C
MKNPLLHKNIAWQTLWDCRGLLAFLGIVIHSARAYSSDPYSIGDASASIYFKYLAHSIHAFRMEAFFILSGAAAYIVFHRSEKNFVADRSVRLLVPLVVTAVLLNLPVLQLTENIINAPLEGSVFTNFLDPSYWLAGEWLLHLWFLRNLMLYTIIYALLSNWQELQSLLNSLVRKPSIKSKLQHRHVILFLVVSVSLFPAVVSYLLPVFHEPILGIGNSLLGSVREHLSYGIYFGAGLILAKKPEFLGPLIKVDRKVIGVCLLVCLLQSTFAIFEVTEAEITALISSKLITKIFIECLRQGTTLAAIYLLIQATTFLISVNLGKTLRIWAKASYTVYLLHLPIVVVLVLALKPLNLPVFLKFSLIVVATSLLCIQFHSMFIAGRIELTRFLFTGKRSEAQA